MCQLLDSLPPVVVEEVVKLVSKKVLPSQNTIITSLILSSSSNVRINPDTVVELVAILRNKSLQLEVKSNINLKLTVIVNLLVLLRKFMNSSDRKVLSDDHQSLLYCDMTDTTVPDTSVDLRPLLLLLSLYKELMVELTVEDWLESVEVKSSVVLESSLAEQIWPEECPPPSNMQMLISHLQHDCRHLMKNLTVAERDRQLLAEVDQAMAATARRFSRSLELNMEEMELGQVVERIAVVETPDWQRQAYLQHLMSDENFEQVLANEDFVTKLGKHVKYLTEHCQKIMNFSLEKGSEPLHRLTREVLNETDADQLVTILDSFHSVHGLNSQLRAANWEERLVLLLNKFSLASEDETLTKELLLLSLEDGESLVKRLVETAAQNKGKISSCASLLVRLKVLCRTPIAESEFLLTGVVTDHLGEEEAGQENVFSLVVAVARSEPELCVQVILRLSQRLPESISSGGSVKKVLEMLQIESVVNCLPHQLRCELFVLSADILNRISRLAFPAERDLTVKGTVLEILRITKLTQAQLKLLNRENISYFKTLPQGSLNDAIRSQYFNQATKVQMESDVLEKGELLLTVSKLMEAEWRILFQSELSSEVLVDVVIEILLHQVPQLTYHIVLALCGHLQPTWPNVLQLLR